MYSAESCVRVPKDKCQLSFCIARGRGRMYYILGQLSGEVCSNRPGQPVFWSCCPDRCSNKRYCVGLLDLKGNNGARCHERKQDGKEVPAIVFGIKGPRE